MTLRSKIREALEEVLAGQEAMHCHRVWDAWSYGTMSEEDFTLVSEDEGAMDEIVSTVLAVILEDKYPTPH